MPPTLADAKGSAGAVRADGSGDVLHYGDPAGEARAARTGAVLLDASGGGAFVVTGRDRVDLLQRISTNDLKRLQPGQGHVNAFVTGKGKLVDRVRICVEDDALLLLTSPGRDAIVRDWIDRYTILEEIALEDLSAQVHQLHLLGPGAAALAATIDTRAAGLGAGGFLTLPESAGGAATLIRTEGLLEDPGFLLVVPHADAAAWWQRLTAGASAARPIGEQAYEAARIATGLPRIGRELTDEHHPLEAGLWGAVSFDKGCYVGQEVLARLRNYDKVVRPLWTVRLDRTPATPPPLPLEAEGREVGRLTSAAGPPLLDEPRGLAYVKRQAARPGATLAAGELRVLLLAQVRVD